MDEELVNFLDRFETLLQYEVGILERVEVLYQYQLLGTWLLAGVLMAFIFVYGLRLR
jgi:hypothetical protein